MGRATYDELYDTLSYQVWKTGREMRNELEEEGKGAGHMRGTMYVYLNNWEEHGLIKSRKRPLTEAEKNKRLTIPSREYLRISTGEPKKLFEGTGGLEGKLIPEST